MTTINDRYLVTKELGQGGMGKVYLVQDTHRENLQLALKTMLSAEVDEGFLDCFRREFADLARLRHSNLAASFDFGRVTETGEYFFTTEFIPGEDLFPATKTSSFDQIVDIARQTLRGLDFLHSHDLIHNDLKPANILLVPADRATERDGRVDEMARLEAAVFGHAGTIKIIDFGLLSASKTRWQQPKGTPRFMSPERIRCLEADGRSDLYAMGCILYLLAGRKQAFTQRTRKDLMLAHLNIVPPRLDAVSSTPEWFATFVEKLLAKDPNDRYPDAASALRALGEDCGDARAKSSLTVRQPEVIAGSLVARSQELAVVRACVERRAVQSSTDASSSAPQTPAAPCLQIEGEAGVGKTRLVEELKAAVQIRGGSLIRFGGRSVQGHLRPIVTEFISGLRTCGADGIDKVAAQLAGPTGGGMRDEFSARLEECLLSLAETVPLVLVFDDFHNCSETVRLFVLSLAQTLLEGKAASSQSDLTVFVLRRPERGKGKIRLSGLDTLELSAFQDEASFEFLRHVFGQYDIPPNVLRHLAQAANGNPSFLLELGRSLVEAEAVHYNGSAWVFPDTIESISLPSTLHGAVERRVRQLGKHARDVLEWFALATAPLTIAGIAHCTLFPAAQVTRIVASLRQAAFLREIDSTEPPSYQIAYADFGEELLSDVDEKRAAFMHQRLAQSFEIGREDPSNDAECAEAVAHHWLAAGNRPGFLRFAPLAADHLQANGNFARAVAYRQEITSSLPDEAGAKKIQSLVKLAEMHEFLWKIEDAERDLRQALDLGEGLLRAKDRVALLRRISSLAISRFDAIGAKQNIQRARNTAGDSPDPLVTVSLEVASAWARWLDGNPSSARKSIEAAEELLSSSISAETLRSPQLIGAHNQLSQLHHNLGNLPRAEELQRANVDVLETLDLPQALAACRCALGAVLLDTGRRDEAAVLLSSALETAKELGDRRTLCRARERLGEYYFHYGEIKRALQLTQVGLEDAELIQHRSASANSLRLLGKIYIRAGQIGEATAALKRAAALNVEAGDAVGEAMTRLAMAQLPEQSDRFLTTQLETTASLAKRFDLRGVAALLRLTEFEATVASGSSVNADQLDAVEREVDALQFTRDHARLTLLRARVALAEGDYSLAQRRLQEFDARRATSASAHCAAEVEFTRALLGCAESGPEIGIALLRRVRKTAKNSVFPALAQRCRDELARLSEQTT